MRKYRAEEIYGDSHLSEVVYIVYYNSTVYPPLDWQNLATPPPPPPHFFFPPHFFLCGVF